MDMKCILVSDFERVCRICMKFDKTLLSINSYKILDMIIACASVQIWENDDLPNQVCNGCYLQLQNTINFKQLCESSDNTFRQIIEQNKNNIWNNQNNLEKVKNEEIDNSNYPVHIKEENDVENVANQNILGNVKSKDDSNTNNTGEILEIKDEDYSELNKVQTRKKTTHYKFDEESDGYESENNYEENGPISEDEGEKSDIEDYKCEICSKLFKKVDSLGVHMRKQHNAKGIKCGRCALICYHPLHLKVHKKTHNKCPICKSTFSTRENLKQHKLTHTDADIPKIPCELCPVILSSKKSFSKHMRSIHKIKKTKNPIKCEACDEIFQRKRLLERHVREMHPNLKLNYKEQVVNCELCNKTVQRRNLRKHMLTHDERRKDINPEQAINCEVCGRLLRNHINLRKHMLTHGERDKIACEYCKKIFISKETLRGHIKIYHKNSGPVYKCLCNQCGHKFRSNYHLNKHLLTHTKERPYACDKCEKTYGTTFQLKEHISRIHLNERNFVCTFCSQAFFDKKILLNHVRRHTGEKPFKCQMCDKRFIQRVALKVHMKVHTNSI